MVSKIKKFQKILEKVPKISVCWKNIFKKILNWIFFKMLSLQAGWKHVLKRSACFSLHILFIENIKKILLKRQNLMIIWRNIVNQGWFINWKNILKIRGCWKNIINKSWKKYSSKCWASFGCCSFIFLKIHSICSLKNM